ncbi:Gfo/Idh/MocA family oxidoreductase [Clostridium sp. CS001]|uniref:Gfo/Idh/MocA family protein n=1 Tax=Clostridium sp. CS001 TaxID=2880648 RepID=UPI001CF316FA|nr:Gfo/Idh/MocA family oxidoreductase [Clostridium sp. CS001]MCB2290578.1 Gfo/Idh/MocA family oxidoreductase [Clostridium sp. CS001]
MRKIRWGIIGLGNMAHKFADALRILQDGELCAVASRSKGKAEEFGEEYSVSKYKCYGSYEELSKDKDIDAVYVAVPNVFHKEISILLLKSGKAVLCEKPIAMNEQETREVIKVAQDNKMFFMEAMWTRFLPVYEKVDSWIKHGLIGEVRMIQGDFGISRYLSPEGIKLNKKLGGGALLDIGVYPVSMCHFLFDSVPSVVKSIAHIGETGVDIQVTVNFGFSKGRVAAFCCSLNAETSGVLHIMGTKGRIELPQYWKGEGAVIFCDGKSEKEVNIPHKCNGYEFEIQEVMNCIKSGKLESDRMSWNKSIEVMHIMDLIKAQWDV